MQDAFTRKSTIISGPILPDAAGRASLQDDHKRRLEALARLRAAAAKCGLRADTDRDLVLIEEDEVILLENAGPDWTEFVRAIREFRVLLPLLRLSTFGFSEALESSPDENSKMRKIGGGVEAWAFESSNDCSIYKFYWPRDEIRIGSEFDFFPDNESLYFAKAGVGEYRALFEKLLVIQA